MLVHGFTGSGTSWDGVIGRCLGARGIEVVTPDLPGHGDRAGEVDPGLFTLDATLEGIARLFRGPDGVPRPAALVGYSMGGRVALHFARRHPNLVQRLVLESASPGLETAEARAERRASDEELARDLEEEGIRSFVARWETLPLFASQDALPLQVRAAVRERRLANEAVSLAASLRGTGTGALPSLWDELPQVQIPTLVLVGGRDEKFVATGKRMAAALPRGILRVVDDAGHTVHLERPDAWCAAVSDFLSGAGG